MTDVAAATDESHGIPPDTFALRLVILRHIHDRISQEEAARRCGVNPSTWATWELGRKPRGMDEVVRRISEAFNCDRNWLMFGGGLSSRCYLGIVDGPDVIQPTLPGIVSPLLVAV